MISNMYITVLYRNIDQITWTVELINRWIKLSWYYNVVFI